MRTLNECLERAAESRDTGLRVLDRRGKAVWLSWETVLQRAEQVAGGLQAAGIRQGDPVALVYPTCPLFIDALFGILLAGAVPVPLYPPVRLGRLDEYHQRTARMLAVARCRMVLADSGVRRILGEPVRSAGPDLGCRSLAALAEGRYRRPALDPDDLGLIQFSSGTTVEPKPVALSHRAILAQASALNRYWPDADGVRHSGVSWLPLYHDMGLIGCLFTAMERPGVLTLIPPESFITRPATWLRTISKYGATISPAPNFAFNLCVEKIRDDELEGVDLRCWRAALNGAETVAPVVIRAFEARFGRFGFRASAMTPVYGMSEAALAVTFSDLASPPRILRVSRSALSSKKKAVVTADGMEIASVGTPLPGFELRILDEAGVPVEEAGVGRIRVRGPSLMEGYYGRPDLTGEVLQDGWLDTGDLGFRVQGELYLTGRVKDMLLLRGRNHPPEEVERAVDRVEGVRTGCAVAVSYLPEAAEGETLLLLVEVARGTAEGVRKKVEEGCRAAVLEATGLGPDLVVALEPGALPRTSSGKKRRSEALRRYRSGELLPPSKVTPLRIAGAMARSALAFARKR